MKRNSGLHRGKCLITNIAKPNRAQFVFNTSFSDKERAIITRVHFRQDFSKRSIPWVLLTDERTAQDPLIVHVVVAANDVEILLCASQFRVLPPGEHVPGFILR